MLTGIIQWRKKLNKLEPQLNLDPVLLNLCLRDLHCIFYLLSHITGLQPHWPFPVPSVPRPEPAPLSPEALHVLSLLSEIPVPALLETIIPASAQGSPHQRSLHWTIYSAPSQYHMSYFYYFHSPYPNTWSRCVFSGLLSISLSAPPESRLQGGQVFVFCFRIPIT